MIETKKHTICRRDIHPDWGGSVLWFEDGMGLKVRDEDIWRSGLQKTCAYDLVGAVATIELVDGRWLLARIESAKVIGGIAP